MEGFLDDHWKLKMLENYVKNINIVRKFKTIIYISLTGTTIYLTTLLVGVSGPK